MNFKNLQGYKGSPLDGVKEYAVNVPLINKDGSWYFIFEVRAFKNISQAGEICLPGGRVEKGEESYSACVRETVEELGVDKEKIEFISELDYTINPMLRIIRSYLTRVHINSLDDLKINPDEVYEVFIVPVDFFRMNKPEEYRASIITTVEEDFPFSLIPGGRSYPWYKSFFNVNFYKFENRIIWGLTAKIISRTIEIFDEYKVL